MAWDDLEGKLASNSAAASWGEFETQVFAIHKDGELWNRYWDGERWHEWESVGGPFTGQPAASARDADRIDLFAIGSDGALRHRHGTGHGGPPGPKSRELPRDTTGVSCSWIGDRLDVFVTAADGRLWYAALGA